MNPVRRAVLRTLFLSKERCGGGRLRPYGPGEDVRAVDWSATARKGSLHVREPDRVTLAWAALADASPSMNAGRYRRLSETAQEAVRFWRGCAAPADRWIELDTGGHGQLLHGLARAMRVLPSHCALLVAGDFFDLPAVPDALLRAVARRMDCTALVARDPWRDDLPLAGFVAVGDLETGNVRRFFIGARERMRFSGETAARERGVLARLRRAGWRAGTFSENEGGGAVLRAFGAR